MTIKEYNYIELNAKTKLNYNAQNYSLNISQVNGSLVSIFNALDTNSDGNLSQNELATFVSEIENSKSELNPWVLESSKKLKKIWEKFIPNEKFNKKDLLGFVQVLQNNYKTKTETVSDGVIDDFCQGKTGDCWLLAQANSLSQTSWGAQIIKEAINYDESMGEYSVNLKGVNFVAKITKEEVEKARKNGKYSTGDIDVLLLEIATEKYFAQEVEAGKMLREKELLNGGVPSGTMSLYFLLNGNNGKSFVIETEQSKNVSDKTEEPWLKALKDSVVNIDEISKEELKNILENIIKNKEDYALSITYKSPKYWNNQNFKKSDKKDYFSNTECHLYSLTKMEISDDGNVILILENPWDTSISIRKTLEEFLAQVGEISIVSKNDSYDDLQII